MKIEERYIPGYEGRYLVSSLGYVRKVGSNKRNYGTVNNRNDNVVHITDNNGRGRMFSMSRIVAEVFLDNPDKKTQVDHIDTNRRNNRADNLRWVWPKENMQNLKTFYNRRQLSLPFKSSDRKGCVAIFPDGRKIEMATMSEMAKVLGCSASSVSRCYYGMQENIFGEIVIKPQDYKQLSIF